MRPNLKLYIILLIVLLSPTLIRAQDGTWDIKGKASKTRSGIAKEKNRVKKFKEHLQQWGLDSNYRHGIFLGGKLNTNGWSGTIYYQKRLTPVQSSIWQLSFSEIKHEKEIKQENTKTKYAQLGNPTPYIFGKMNNLYTIQLGYGREHVLLPNVVEDNLTVSFRWTAGFSMAILKPYYLRLIHDDTFPVDTLYMAEERHSAVNSELFLNNNRILGASKWTEGLGEIEYIPGAYADIAFVIEPAKNKTFVQVITLGVNSAFYSNQLPVMANQPTTNWQAGLYVGLILGKRWR